MERQFENRRNMYGTVLTFLTTHIPLISTKPTLLKAFNKFRGIVTEIDCKATLLKEDWTAKTETRNTAIKELIDLLMPISTALLNLGTNTNDNDLISKNDYTRSKFENLSDTSMMDVAALIISSANINLTTLTKYNITQDTVTEANNRWLTFRTSIGLATFNVDQKKTINDDLKKLFMQADNILKVECDKHIELIQKDNRTVYDEYFSAREIRDTGVNIDITEEKTVTDRTTK